MPYDPRKTEDKWFAIHEKDLIKRIQIERERTEKELAEVMKKEEARKHKELHWMRCSKCGAELYEEDLLGIIVDICPLCDGIYFDQSELQDLILKSMHERRQIVMRILNLPLDVATSTESVGPESEFLKRLHAARSRKEKELAWVLEHGEARKRKDLHWMKCPKCGSDLIQEDYEGVTVDTCSVCKGVYIDRLEFQELLLKRQEDRQNVLMRIIRVFSS